MRSFKTILYLSFVINYSFFINTNYINLFIYQCHRKGKRLKLILLIVALSTGIISKPTMWARQFGTGVTAINLTFEIVTYIWPTLFYLSQLQIFISGRVHLFHFSFVIDVHVGKCTKYSQSVDLFFTVQFSEFHGWGRFFTLGMLIFNAKFFKYYIISDI